MIKQSVPLQQQTVLHSQQHPVLPFKQHTLIHSKKIKQYFHLTSIQCFNSNSTQCLLPHISVSRKLNNQSPEYIHMHCSHTASQRTTVSSCCRPGHNLLSPWWPLWKPSCKPSSCCSLVSLFPFARIWRLAPCHRTR